VVVAPELAVVAAVRHAAVVVVDVAAVAGDDRDV
jgi:hypothetical protein